MYSLSPIGSYSQEVSRLYQDFLSHLPANLAAVEAAKNQPVLTWSELAEVTGELVHGHN